jgi:hypothetical protein
MRFQPPQSASHWKQDDLLTHVYQVYLHKFVASQHHCVKVVANLIRKRHVFVSVCNAARNPSAR